MSIQALTEMSREYGVGEEYVVAGGGNSSVKIDGVLHVKASGTSLRTITPRQFVAMDMARLTAMLDKTYPENDDQRETLALADMMAARIPGEEQKRPSVEALLHAIFPYKYVLHTHPAILNGLSCSKNGKIECENVLGDKTVWIPLTKPGYILATVCNAIFIERKETIGEFPKVVVLQNHGLFVAADSVEEIHTIMTQVISKLSGSVHTTPDFTLVEDHEEMAFNLAPIMRFCYDPQGKAIAVFCANKQILMFSKNTASMVPIMAPFTPDHIVYTKDKPLYIEVDSDYPAVFDQFKRENGYYPKIVVLRDLGFFALGKTKNEADIALLLFLDAMKIAVYSQSYGGPCALPDDFTQFILNWEIESYRQKVALSSAGEKRMEGKIAIVTGAARGIGRAIAAGLASQGAYVVLADMSREGAQLFARELVATYGAGTACAVMVDVTKEESVASLVHATVLGYGGLDILVSNAGIAIAGDLSEMTKEDFERVSSVNYTGYFLCAKYASVPMKLQRECKPDYTSDIIEINSKSGLVGSNKNFAYAGSKFGGVGLTQSFALELVEYGIKVNAICPGNLLDGDLWSDPHHGLFKQYFDSGKVPGAKSVADVRKFYESKVPMGRGCTTDDVVRALYYVIEQQYETGQAIPVTGGQIMLK